MPLTQTGWSDDAMATPGGEGSVNAKLRLMTQQLNTLSSGAASENHLGEVGGNSELITPTLTVTASSAYAAGNVVGGVLTLTGAMRKSGGSGLLQDILIIDQDNQKPALDIFLFNQNPANGTYADKTALSWNATDLGFLIRVFSISSADYITDGGVAFAPLPNLGRVVKASGSANLYALIVLTAGTPAWTGTGKLVTRFGFLRD